MHLEQSPRTSRRHFLQQSVLAAGSAAFWPSALSPARKFRILVIGAGLSGLAAACRLRKNGHDVVVLEARNRIGGRVFSHRIDPAENLVIELGAEWIGYSHTRIRELCDELNLPLDNNQLDTRLIYQNRYFEKDEWGFSTSWETEFSRLLTAFKTMSEAERNDLDKLDWWRYLVNHGCEGRDLTLRELLDSTDFGESTRHVSALVALSTFAESSPKNEMDLKIRGGNSSLAEALALKIGKDRIFTDHAVETIHQKDKVTVRCRNGKSFTGDKLICTVPAFALPQIQWNPELPAVYTEAVNELQYARINKNALLFRERFWQDERFDLVTDQTPHYFYHATKNQRSRKGVLISYSIGEKAEIFSNQDDDWKAAAMQQTLAPRFGDIRPLLEKQVNYYWGDDRFSRGAYALYGVNQWTRVRAALQKPFLHAHFAGEHLADWQGFMEGAIVTGEEAAAACIET